VKDAGFTLVEMLMAITITATVAVAAMGALDQLTDADARVTERMESTVGVYRALQTFRRDIADAQDFSVAPERVLVNRPDGSVVDYRLLASSTELHRVVWDNALLVPLLVLDTVSSVTYGPRGHLRDSDYRPEALVQGAKSIAFTAINGRRTGRPIGVKLSVLHRTSHGPHYADALGLCLAQLETEAKP